MTSDALTAYVAGHTGLVGSAIVGTLEEIHPEQEIITRTRSELDLTQQQAVTSFFRRQRIDHLYIAAAKVGGIHANQSYPADFIRDNLSIQSNLIESAHRTGIKRLLFLGSSCIYPRNAEQPIREDELLTGPLERTNEAYAIAKIAGIKMCESYNAQYGTDYRSLMPTNLYGPGDDYYSSNSRVIPALISRFHIAKVQRAPRVEVWGSGRPKREFLHVADLAAACVHVMSLPSETYWAELPGDCPHVNIGTGRDVSIAQLARTIANTVGYEGAVDSDTRKPDGTPRKLLDVSRATRLGWQATIPLQSGLKSTYEAFLEQHQVAKDP